jgi:S1-C subfamily serine protease/cytochrome c-type biogenesis protein CcmH/NrfG
LTGEFNLAFARAHCVEKGVSMKSHVANVLLVGAILSGRNLAFAQSPSATPIGTPSASASPQSFVAAFDVGRIAGDARPAVALIAVHDKAGKTIKVGTGFFVAADGTLVTNAHVLEGAATAEAKLENGASYNILGVLKIAIEKDLVLAKVDAKKVPFLRIATGALPEAGTRVVVVGSPFGLEGSVSEGIISGQRTAKPDDEWLQITAAISPGSSGSPVIDPQGNVVGVATFIVAKAQSVNFARPAEYISQLLDQLTPTTEAAPLWTIATDQKHIVLNDPDFIEAENSLAKNDPAKALKALNKLQPKYSENESFLLKLGLVYDRLNLLDDAVRTYQHALKIDPTNGMGWTNLALTYVKLRRFSEAKDAASQAVRQSPDFGPAWGVLGYSYQQEGRFADAADALQKAAKLTPRDPDIWRNLSDTYEKLNEPAKSQEAGRKLAELSATPAASPTGLSVGSPTPAQRPTSIVTAPASKGLNIRSAPDGRSGILATLQPQDRVYLGDGRVRNNEPPLPVVWQQVTSMSGVSGWINVEYLGPPENSNSSASPNRDIWEVYEKWLAASSSDPSKEASLYADPSDYLDAGMLSRQQLAQELQRDIQRWPNQHNRVSRGPIIEKISDSEWRVTFEFVFDVRNPLQLKRVTGNANLIWTLRKRASGGVEIVSSKEQVTSRTIRDIKPNQR